MAFGDLLNRPLLLLGAVFVVAAVLWRLVNHEFGIAPNLELLTAAGFGAVILFSRTGGLFIPAVLCVVTDLIIGTTWISLFTISAWLLCGVVVRGSVQLSLSPLMATLAGMTTSTVFFVWTNFGVWLLGGGVFYEMTTGGLAQCYIAGLPFYRTMLVGNLVFVPFVVWISSSLLAQHRQSGAHLLPARVESGVRGKYQPQLGLVQRASDRLWVEREVRHG